MTNIQRLRDMTSAAYDETFNGVTYWTDEQLQGILDTYSRYDYTRKLIYRGLIDNLNVYTIDVPRHWGLVSISGVYDYVDLQARTVRTVTPLESTLIQECFVIDFNAAAADVWQQKAVQRQNYVNWRAGSHAVSANQEREYCQKMADMYRARRIKAWR